MSNRAHRRRRRPQLSRSTTTSAALVAAQSRGCKCRPDITRRHLGTGEWVATVAHDGWCPAVDAASQLAILLPPKRDGRR